jgi:hypothetical protein
MIVRAIVSLFVIVMGLMSSSYVMAVSTERGRISEVAGDAQDTGIVHSLFWFEPAIPYVQTEHSREVHSVAFDPATPDTALALFGFAPGHLARTIDGGFTWSHLSPVDFEYPYTAHRLAYAGERGTYYAWGAREIFKTTDHGDSWSLLPRTCNYVQHLVVHPTQRGLIYAGTGGSFLRSTDGGESWEAPNRVYDECGNNMPSITLAVGVDRPDVVYRGLGVGSGGGVKRSENRGDTWVDASNGLPLYAAYPYGLHPVFELVVNPRDADVVYALAGDAMVYGTVDGGRQWTILDRGLGEDGVTHIQMDTEHGTGLYAMTRLHLYSFDEDDREWRLVPTTPPYNDAQWRNTPLDFELRFDPSTPGRPLLFGRMGLRIGLQVGDQKALPLVARCLEWACY